MCHRGNLSSALSTTSDMEPQQQQPHQRIRQQQRQATRRVGQEKEHLQASRSFSWPLFNDSTMHVRSLCLTLATLVTLAHSIGAYQFPIPQQQPLVINHSNRRHSGHPAGHRLGTAAAVVAAPMGQNEPIGASSRRMDDEMAAQQQQQQQHMSAGGQENEAQQLRKLHQVVDTMAQLLNDEELEQEQLAANARSSGSSGKAAAATGAAGGVEQSSLSLHQMTDANGSPFPKAHELSEGAIRQALEELERVQQQEREREQGASAGNMAGAESRLRPAILAAPTTDNNNNNNQALPSAAALQAAAKQSAIESLIDELGEELIDDQLMAASQEAERLIQQRESPRQPPPPAASMDANNGVLSNRQQSSDNAGRQLSAASASFIAEAQQPLPSSTVAPSQSNNNNSDNNYPANPTTAQTSQSSLYIGHLDSLGPSSSDLGAALTNDFYQFHAEATGAVAKQQQQPQQNNNAAAPQRDGAPSGGLDLDSAAQTRNSVAQADHSRPQSTPFGHDSSTLRFDFSQPQHPSPNLGGARQEQSAPNQDHSLVRATFSQQAGNERDGGESQFTPTSTLLPIASPDNFWRPSGPNAHNAENPSDINQQYDRARAASQHQQVLPEPRFQSLTPQTPFGSGQQQPAQAQQPPQHIHFTGHSLIPSSLQGGGGGGVGNARNPSGRAQQSSFGGASTSAPLISILSASDGTSGNGNSVSWNPPPAINQPAQQQFPGPSSTPSSSSSPPRAFGQENFPPQPPQQFFPPPPPPHPSSANSRGPPSPLFNGAFHQQQHHHNQALPPAASSGGATDFRPHHHHSQPQLQPQHHHHHQQQGLPQPPPNFETSTELNGDRPELTTEDQRFQPPPPVTTQWSPAAGSQLPPFERDVSDSRPSSTVRSLAPAHNNNNQRFFSPNDLLGPPAITSTFSPPPLLSSTESSRSNQRGANQHQHHHHLPPAITTTTTTTTSTTTPASIAGAALANNGTAKKEDMVIYYYYYYDDNKNATVVAKNISSPAGGNNGSGGSVPLDAAIEADGGVEDTPYMDDPAPMTNLRTSAFNPTNIDTTTTTTTLPSTVVAHTNNNNNNFRSTFSEGPSSTLSSRFVQPTSTSRAPTSSEPSSRLHFSEREFGDQPRNDQPRTHTTGNTNIGNRQATSSATNSQRQQFHEPASVFTPAPFNLQPSTSSARPAASRNVATEPTLPTRARDSELNHQPHHRHPEREPTVPSNRLQTDLINNVLNGIPATNGAPLARQSNSGGGSSSAPTLPVSAVPSASGSSGNSQRGPLSNASRYGTNNNLMMDPYGLDPAAPATLGAQANHNHHHHHASSSSSSSSAAAADNAAAAALNQKQKNWQQQQQGSNAPSSSAHHHNHLGGGGRKPAPEVAAISSTESPLARTRSSSAATVATANSQHFSSQRNSNALQPATSPQPPRAALAAAPAALPSATTSGQQGAGARLSGSIQQPASGTSRQQSFFPELSSTANAAGTGNVDLLQRVSSPASVSRTTAGEQGVQPPTPMIQSRPQQPTVATTRQRDQQPQQSLPSVSGTSEFGATNNRLTSHGSEQESPALFKESVASSPINRQPPMSNGRPSTPEGNTGNGFTRSPIQSSTATFIQSSTPPSISSSTPLATSSGGLAQRVSGANAPLSPQPASTPAIVSTSVSRSFVTPQQIQVTTSVSPPTVTSTSSAMTTISTTQSPSASSSSSSSSTTPNTPSQDTTVNSTPSSVPISTSAAQEASPSTEGADSASVSTRRKFGNRNNRLQTRLNSVGGSRSQSVSTSTTTASPSISSTTTTRRPSPSTTRKSSKQLFAGRRRLSSSQSSSSSSSPSADGSAPPVGPQAPAVASTSAPPIGSESSSPSSPAASPQPPARTRFGNSFTARSRLTPAPAPAADVQSGSTQRPSLFGAQRATSRPRLPFMKPSTRPSSAGPVETTTSQSETTMPVGNSANTVAADGVSPSMSSEKLATGTITTTTSEAKPLGSSSNNNNNNSELSEEQPMEDASPATSMPEDESADKRESSSSAAAATAASNASSPLASEATTVPSPSSPSSAEQPTSVRNKPKVRPLFASRQRNSSLFGNRRSNSTSTIA